MAIPPARTGRSSSIEDRRRFLQGLAAAAAAAGAVRLAPGALQAQARGPARTRLAIAGVGGRGLRLARFAQSLTTCEVVAVADAYDGRLARAKELLGEKVATARDGRALLDRGDVDAVVIATPDHLHAPLATAALAAGTHVYLERPVAVSTADRDALVAAAAAHPRVVQCGGGWITSPLFTAARRFVQDGALGRVLLATGTWDSGSALDAWQAPYPPDASPDTVDFAAFLGDRPSRPFDPGRFFRWRAHAEFGSGLAGSRFVPQLTALHWLLGLGVPARCAAIGTLARWRDGRDQPDTLAASFHYAEGPVVSLSATLNGTGRPAELRLVGTDATLVIAERRLSLLPEPPVEPYPDVAETWAKPYRDWFYMMHGMSRDGLVRGAPDVEKTTEVFELPQGAGTAAAHLADFLDAIRTGQPPREPLTLGLEAAMAGVMAARAAASGAVVRREDL